MVVAKASDGLFTELRDSSSKLSLSMSNQDNTAFDNSTRSYSSSKRSGEGSSQGKSNPFNTVLPLSTSGVASPGSGASSAFGLGSGAFASFGAAKTPKSPGNGLDFASAAAAHIAQSPSVEKGRRDSTSDPLAGNIRNKASSSSLTNLTSANSSEHPLKYSWVVWYRPPTSKYSDYEKSTIPLAGLSSVEAFWTIYAHLKRPSSLPTVSDYHFFRKGVRPVWEDKENKKGGKWILRLKKGVADRYWDDLLLAMIGDQFAEAGEEVCGAVLSVRSGEDVLSVWTRIDGGRNIKIRWVFPS